MKIGIVTTWFERGAAYVSRQYKKTLENIHEVFIYARGGESYGKHSMEWDSSKITWGKKANVPASTGINIADFEKWLYEKEIEIVFFNEQRWWDPIVKCAQIGIKTGAYVDYYTEDSIDFYGIYDFLICNTQRHYSAFKWHRQSFYVPWGTDIELFKPQSYRLINKDVLTFYHTCGYSPERKGTDLVIKAFIKLERPAKLLIHTQIDLNKHFSNNIEILDCIKNNKNIDIIYKTVSVPGLYHLGDVAVYPSRLDGIGLTVAEALSCGLPVITSDNPPMSEFINNENGRLVKIDKLYAREDGYYWPQCEVNLESLIENMNYYAAEKNNIDFYKKKAREYAEKHLNWKANTIELPEIFNKVELKEFKGKENVIEKLKMYERRKNSISMKLYNISPMFYKLLKAILK